MGLAMSSSRSPCSQIFEIILLTILMASSLGQTRLPREWLISRLTFIPKIVAPLSPKDLRPIVLSSVPGKVFTKLLLYRLRAHFPQMVAGQLSSVPGAQTLKASCSLQQCVRLSNEYALPLVIAKLDIASAFDHLDHLAISKFFRLLGPHREAESSYL